MYCFRCGTKVDDKVEYCPHCGANIKEELSRYNYSPNENDYIKPTINLEQSHEEQFTYSKNYSNIKKICQHCYASKNCKICLLCLDNLDKLGTDEFICPGFQDKEYFKNRLNKIFYFL